MSDSSVNSSPPTAAFRLGYRPELDGFRGLSIIFVFVHHLYYPLLPGGFLGVDMFFVLSGFLITSLLLQEWEQTHSINLKNFYIRRFLRLMPAVFLLILATGLFAMVWLDKSSAEKTYQGIWLTLSYVSNWFYAFKTASADNPLGVTWSLAIEEQFYLVFPVAIYLAFKFKMSARQIMLALVVLSAAVALHRHALAIAGAATPRLYYGSDTRADALLIGCLSAFLVARHSLLLKKLETFLMTGAVLSLLFLALMTATADWSDAALYQSGGYTLIALSVALLLMTIVVFRPAVPTRILSFGPLVWIGRVSYGLYLWHWTIRYFIYQGEIMPASNLDLAVAVILSVTFTAVSFYFVERPFLRWKSLFGETREPVKA